MKNIKPLIVVLIIGIPAAVIAYLALHTDTATISNTETSTPITTTTATRTEQKYKDGTYSATGTYMSPGGKEEVPLTITLKNDIIVEAQFTPIAILPISKEFQTQFATNFKPLVIGKNIDTIMLTKVSGSSLTPKGFNDALAQIKVQAQS